MGHQINAIIGSERTLLGLAARLGPPRPTEVGLNLWALPLNEQRLDMMAMSVEPRFDGFTYLSPTLAHAIAQGLGEGSALYIETAYFGGMGDQGAALFENGKLVWKKSESTFRSEKPKSLFARLISGQRLPPKSPISEGLGSLGVVPASGEDEFDCVGLGRFRTMEAFGIEYDDDD